MELMFDCKGKPFNSVGQEIVSVTKRLNQNWADQMNLWGFVCDTTKQYSEENCDGIRIYEEQIKRATFTHARILFSRIALKENLLDKNRDWVIIRK